MAIRTVPIPVLKQRFVLAGGKLLNHDGTEPGSLRVDGYRQVRFNGQLHSVHRIVFAMANGYWPKGYVDHINRKKADNRPENLRDVTPSQNVFNRVGNSDSQSGIKGVYKTTNGRWRAQICAHGVRISLGVFQRAEEAAAAYAAGARRYHGEFARTQQEAG